MEGFVFIVWSDCSFVLVSSVQCYFRYLLTPWCRVLEKLTGLQLVKKFPAFYGTRRFITAVTSAHHLSLSWVSLIHSTPPHPTFWRYILILPSHLHLGLPSGLFPSGFPTKTLCTPHLSPIRATCPAHRILDFIARTILVTSYTMDCFCDYSSRFCRWAMDEEDRGGWRSAGFPDAALVGVVCGFV